jgi:cytosine/uracil/thiamine/allantoin permease
MFNNNQTNIIIMDFKKSILNLLLCLLVSPVIIYIILGLAGLAGSTYEMTNGETFIIWLLMAIVIRLAIEKKS